MQSAVVGIAVLVPAARGDWATAEAHVARDGPARRSAELGYERSPVALGMSRARIGEARGDPAAVVAALEPVPRFPHRDAADEPGFWPWQDLYAEALVGVGPGRRGRRASSSRTRSWPPPRGRRSAIARLARARGRVEAAAGRPDTARARPSPRALAATEEVELPVRAGPDRAGRGRLPAPGRAAAAGGRAADRGRAAVSPRWARRPTPSAARRSWPRPGSSRPPGTAGTATGLTSQELVVARLAAAGPQQPGDRRRAGGQHQDRRVPPAQRVPEAGRDLAPAAAAAAGALDADDSAEPHWRSHCTEVAPCPLAAAGRERRGCWGATCLSSIRTSPTSCGRPTGRPSPSPR